MIKKHYLYNWGIGTIIDTKSDKFANIKAHLYVLFSSDDYVVDDLVRLGYAEKLN